MSRVEVEAIEHPRDTMRFVKSWWRVYRDDPHWVPPILAGVSIHGKLGAANETTQALTLLENLNVLELRRSIESALQCSLGTEEPFKEHQFTFEPMLDRILKAMESAGGQAGDAIASSKGEALNQPGRDFTQGKLERGRNG